MGVTLTVKRPSIIQFFLSMANPEQVLSYLQGELTDEEKNIFVKFVKLLKDYGKFPTDEKKDFNNYHQAAGLINSHADRDKVKKLVGELQKLAEYMLGDEAKQKSMRTANTPFDRLIEPYKKGIILPPGMFAKANKASREKPADQKQTTAQVLGPAFNFLRVSQSFVNSAGPFYHEEIDAIAAQMTPSYQLKTGVTAPHISEQLVKAGSKHSTEVTSEIKTKMLRFAFCYYCDEASLKAEFGCDQTGARSLCLTKDHYTKGLAYLLDLEGKAKKVYKSWDTILRAAEFRNLIPQRIEEETTQKEKEEVVEQPSAIKISMGGSMVQDLGLFTKYPAFNFLAISSSLMEEIGKTAYAELNEIVKHLHPDYTLKESITIDEIADDLADQNRKSTARSVEDTYELLAVAYCYFCDPERLQEDFAVSQQDVRNDATKKKAYALGVRFLLNLSEVSDRPYETWGAIVAEAIKQDLICGVSPEKPRQPEKTEVEATTMRLPQATFPSLEVQATKMELPEPTSPSLVLAEPETEVATHVNEESDAEDTQTEPELTTSEEKTSESKASDTSSSPAPTITIAPNGNFNFLRCIPKLCGSVTEHELYKIDILVQYMNAEYMFDKGTQGCKKTTAIAGFKKHGVYMNEFTITDLSLPVRSLYRYITEPNNRTAIRKNSSIARFVLIARGDDQFIQACTDASIECLRSPAPTDQKEPTVQALDLADNSVSENKVEEKVSLPAPLSVKSPGPVAPTATPEITTVKTRNFIRGIQSLCDYLGEPELQKYDLLVAHMNSTYEFETFPKDSPHKKANVLEADPTIAKLQLDYMTLRLRGLYRYVTEKGSRDTLLKNQTQRGVIIAAFKDPTFVQACADQSINCILSKAVGVELVENSMPTQQAPPKVEVHTDEPEIGEVVSSSSTEDLPNTATPEPSPPAEPTQVISASGNINLFRQIPTLRDTYHADTLELYDILIKYMNAEYQFDHVTVDSTLKPKNAIKALIDAGFETMDKSGLKTWKLKIRGLYKYIVDPDSRKAIMLNSAQCAVINMAINDSLFIHACKEQSIECLKATEQVVIVTAQAEASETPAIPTPPEPVVDDDTAEDLGEPEPSMAATPQAESPVDATTAQGLLDTHTELLVIEQHPNGVDGEEQEQPVSPSEPKVEGEESTPEPGSTELKAQELEQAQSAIAELEDKMQGLHQYIALLEQNVALLEQQNQNSYDFSQSPALTSVVELLQTISEEEIEVIKEDILVYLEDRGKEKVIEPTTEVESEFASTRVAKFGHFISNTDLIKISLFTQISNAQEQRISALERKLANQDQKHQDDLMQKDRQIADIQTTNQIQKGLLANEGIHLVDIHKLAPEFDTLVDRYLKQP